MSQASFIRFGTCVIIFGSWIIDSEQIKNFKPLHIFYRKLTNRYDWLILAETEKTEGNRKIVVQSQVEM